MSEYRVQVSVEVGGFLDLLDVKSRRIIRSNLGKLGVDPYLGGGVGDKERLVVGGELVYGLHVGRMYTAFYVILEGERVVRVFELLPIGKAHKKYGY